MDIKNLIKVEHDRFIINLLYATDNNVLGYPIYQELGLDICLAHPDLYEKIMKLPPLLEEKSLKLVIYDIYRPVPVQQKFWDMLPDERYVDPPEKGSLHNRGVAIDCYLAQEDGTPLPFPTAPDGYIKGIDKDWDNWMAYLEKAHHTYVGTSDEKEACDNRDMLRNMMEKVGLQALNEEWWHYEIKDAYGYPIVDIFDDDRQNHEKNKL